MNYAHKQSLLALIEQWHAEFCEDDDFPIVYPTQTLFKAATESVAAIFDAAADGVSQENKEHAD